jgi:hypothetical protein
MLISAFDHETVKKRMVGSSFWKGRRRGYGVLLRHGWSMHSQIAVSHSDSFIRSSAGARAGPKNCLVQPRARGALLFVLKDRASMLCAK